MQIDKLLKWVDQTGLGYGLGGSDPEYPMQLTFR